MSIPVQHVRGVPAGSTIHRHQSGACTSPLAGFSSGICVEEADVELEGSRSNCVVFLNFSGCSSCLSMGFFHHSKLGPLQFGDVSLTVRHSFWRSFSFVDASHSLHPLEPLSAFSAHRSVRLILLVLLLPHPGPDPLSHPTAHQYHLLLLQLVLASQSAHEVSLAQFAQVSTCMH